MLENFTFNNGEAIYKEDMFPHVVDLVIRAFPSANITIHYAHTTRTTSSYEIVMDTVKHACDFIEHLTIEAKGSRFYVSPTSVKATVGDVTVESILLSSCSASVENAADMLVARGMGLRRVLIAAAGILERARVYYDDLNELSYLPTDFLPTLDLDPEHFYEVYVEGVYRGRPTRVGVSADDFLYIYAGNKQLEAELADLIISIID